MDRKAKQSYQWSCKPCRFLACYSSITENANLSCKCTKLSAISWIIDSVVPHYMTCNKTLLKIVRILLYPFLVNLPNGYNVKVSDIGDAFLNVDLTLHRVLFVPSFNFNLISVHYLKLQLKGIIAFSGFSCLLHDTKDW